MKRQSFTLIELLTVIAIMAILAGILMPVLGSARARARTSTCSSNQSQLTKFLQIAMDKQDSKLYSGAATVNANGVATATTNVWTKKLYDKNIVSDLKSLRCTEIPIDTAYADGHFVDSSNNIDHASIGAAYGMVTATSGSFNFKGTRLLRYTDSSDVVHTISPSALILGGCSINGKGLPLATMAFTGDIVDTNGKTGAIHGGSDANVFFLDGHVETVDGATIRENKYFPKADGSGAELIPTADTASDIYWLTKDKAIF